MDFVIGGLAAGGAAVFSNPFDVIKTRLQLQGELRSTGQHSVHYKNTVHAAYVIFKNEGIRGIQKGLTTAVVMHTVRNSVRLGIYEWLTKNGYLTDSKGKTIFYRSALGGAFAGAAGAFLGSPLFLIKTQLQSQADQSIAVGHQHGHNGAVQALMSIYNQFGIKGLWRGLSGTVARAIAGSSAQLTSFAITKDVLKETALFRNSPMWSAFVSSIVGGVFQTILMTPFDLVSIRLYNQGVDARGKGLLYSGLIDCFVKIGKAEGFFGFYKGIAANYMRLAPHSALCLLFWDYLKDLQNRYLTSNKGSKD